MAVCVDSETTATEEFLVCSDLMQFYRGQMTFRESYQS